MLLVGNVIASLEHSTFENRAKYLRDLVVLAFQKRDIRGQFGGGERTLSYWMFLRLHEMFPITMETLLQDLPNIGSWLDFKKLYEITSEDIKKPNDGSRDWYRIRQARINFNKKLIDIWTIQCQLDEITLDSNIESADDKEDCTVSLCFKWIPKPKSALDRKYKVCAQLARSLYPSLYNANSSSAKKKYRQLVSRGNKAINTTECFMAQKQFGNINFRLVPGRCLNKFHRAWKDVDKKGNRRHYGDEDREACIRNYIAFLELVKQGKVSAKGKSMFIHEIVRDVKRAGGADQLKLQDSSRYTLLEGQFRDHVNSFSECTDVSGLDDTVFLTDVSGSMDGDPMDAAVGVSVLGTSISKGAYRNKVLTFESIPRWVSLDYPESAHQYMNGFPGYSGNKFPIGNSYEPSRVGKELDYLEKITVVLSSGWGGSTNFLAAINLIYQCAQLAGTKMPKKAICITDMAWDCADRTGGFQSAAVVTNTDLESIPDMTGSYLTNIEQLRSYFESVDMNMPEFVVWNARGNQRSNGCVAAADTPGVQMISGFSTAMLKLFLSEGTFGSTEEGKGGPNSWDTLRQLLDHENYDQIRHVIAMVGEKDFAILRPEPIVEDYVSESKETAPPTSSTYTNKLPFDIDNMSPEQLKALLGQVLKKL